MSLQMNRRRFLHTASGSALCAAAGALSTSISQDEVAAEAKDESVTETALPIVDTHQHLWDLDKFHLPWLKNEGARPINRSFVMSDYVNATAGLNVVKTIYMEVNVHPDQQAQEAEYVIDLCQRDDNPMVAAVIGGFPHAENFADFITPFSQSPYVKGVRTVLHDADRPQGLCLQPRFVDNIKRLGELGLRFDLCMRPGEILDGVKLVDQCPKTQFVVDHCGNMSVESKDEKLRETWMRGMREMAQRPNVVCKISGIIVTAKKDAWRPEDLAPNMNFCMEAFGEDRIVFGGDWPVCTLKAGFRQWADALKWIVRDRSPEFQRKLFHDNAVRFYGLA